MIKNIFIVLAIFVLWSFFIPKVSAQQCTGSTNSACTYNNGYDTTFPLNPYYVENGGKWFKVNGTVLVHECHNTYNNSGAGYACGAFLGNNTCGGCIPNDSQCSYSGNLYFDADCNAGACNTYSDFVYISNTGGDFNFCGGEKVCTSGCGYIPPCSSGTVNCGGWGAAYGYPANTCYTGNATHARTCQHNAPQTCTNTNFTDYGSTTVDNCYYGNGYACVSGNCVTNITVHVYKDYNHNGVQDAEDTPLSGVTITDNGGNFPTTDANGQVVFTGKTTGNYTITMTTPANYQATTATSQVASLTNNSGNASITFLVQPLYRIQGRVYNDEDSGRCYNPPGQSCTDKTTNTNHGGGIDTTYNTSSTTVSVVGTGVNQSLTQGDGTYNSGLTLPAGTYTVSYTNIPTNYNMTYPLNGPPPSFSVTVGTPGKSYACTTNNVNDATCDGTGNISELNFGMNNHITHTTGWCTDWRNEVSSQNFIPNNATCGTVSGQYVIMSNLACPVTATSGPGIYYSGAVTPDFGYGSANPNNWLVGGATAENFTPVNPGVTRTSNSYLRTTLKDNGITPTDLSSVCTPSNCYLPDNLPSGVYSWNFDTTIVGTKNSGTGVTTNGTYTFPTGKNYVFIIGNRDNSQNADLTIKSKLLVPNGSTATFSVANNINIDPSVGESDVTSTAGDVEGFYSADASFIIQSSYVSSNRCNDNGTTKDLRFNLIGSVTVNAAGIGGTLQNQRDLCASDLSCPTYSIGNGSGSGSDVNLGLTYWLNAPALIKHKNSFWQELAP